MVTAAAFQNRGRQPSEQSAAAFSKKKKGGANQKQPPGSTRRLDRVSGRQVISFSFGADLAWLAPPAGREKRGLSNTLGVLLCAVVFLCPRAGKNGDAETAASQRRKGGEKAGLLETGQVLSAKRMGVPLLRVLANAGHVFRAGAHEDRDECS